MLDKINKVPAGTFIVPLILSMVVYTIWPNLFMIGGMTQALFSGQGVTVITAILTFVSGTVIDIKQVGQLLKRQGVLFLAKTILGVVAAWLFITVFGHSGVFGINSLAFVAVITSSNTAIYLLTAQDYGNEVDTGAFGLFGLFSIPVLPTVIFSFAMASTGGVNWTPVLSILIPLVLGIILGNIDPKFRDLFKPGIPVLLPILGWNLGQGLNLIEAFQSGVSGLVLTFIFIVIMSLLYVVDKIVLKNDGLYGLSLITVAGLSTSAPSILASSYPQLISYVPTATAQALMAVIITTVGMPILISIIGKKNKGNKNKKQ